MRAHTRESLAIGYLTGSVLTAWYHATVGQALAMTGGYAAGLCLSALVAWAWRRRSRRVHLWVVR